MGLDTSHECWHGPYSSFHSWRKAIATAAGLDLDKLWEDTATNSNATTGRWTETPDNALMVLLLHSDCDGVIQHAQCKPLADALMPLVAKVPDQWRAATVRFIAGLITADAVREDVDFH